MRRSIVEIPEMLRTPIGDAVLPYLLYGGAGPPLILLHATGFHPSLWHPVARELAGEYRILAPSLCDYREADPEAGGLDWVVLAEDIVRLCKVLGVERPFLAGHSMGATVLMMAHALFGLPTSGMVLIEPILLPQAFYREDLHLADHPLAARALRRANGWRDRDEAMAYLRSRPLFQGWDEEVLALYLDHGMTRDEAGVLRLTCAPRREAALFMGGMQFDPWPLLAKVTCPVLLLEGEKSENRDFIDLQQVRSCLPVAEYHLVEKAAHLIPMERPRETARLMGGFFRSL